MNAAVFCSPPPHFWTIALPPLQQISAFVPVKDTESVFSWNHLSKVLDFSEDLLELASAPQMVPYLFSPLTNNQDSLPRNSAQRVKLCTAKHSSASASQNENYQVKEAKVQCLTQPRCPNQPGTCDGKKQHQQHRMCVFPYLGSNHSLTCGRWGTLYANYFLPWQVYISYILISFPTGWPLSRAGIRLSRSSFSITDVWNMLFPEQSQHTNTGANNTDTIKPTNGKDIPVWCPRCLIWWDMYFKGYALTSHFILHSEIVFNAHCFKQSYGEL